MQKLVSLCFLIFSNIFTVKKIVNLETGLVISAISEMMKIFEYEQLNQTRIKNRESGRDTPSKSVAPKVLDENNNLYSKTLLLTSFFKMLFNCMANDAYERIVLKIEEKDIFNYTISTILKIDPKEHSLHYLLLKLIYYLIYTSNELYQMFAREDNLFILIIKN